MSRSDSVSFPAARLSRRLQPADARLLGMMREVRQQNCSSKGSPAAKNAGAVPSVQRLVLPACGINCLWRAANNVRR